MRYEQAAQRRKRSLPSAPDVQKKALGSSRVGSTRNTDRSSHLRRTRRNTVTLRRSPGTQSAGVAESGPAGVIAGDPWWRGCPGGAAHTYGIAFTGRFAV